ncbi:branched-chain amino acid ABC transporter permease [Thermodesulfobacteriota bacterium]
MRYLKLLYQIFKGEVIEIPARIIMFLFIFVLFLVPVFTSNSYVLRILNVTAIFSIYAASWDLLGGFVGQINLGQALFFAIGAYVAALLNLYFGWIPWITIPLGGVSSIIVGLFAGIPTLRLRGFYLALVTLTFPIIFAGLVHLFPDLSGGELGLYGVKSLSNSHTLNYYIILLIMLVSVFIIYKFSDAKSAFVRVGIILLAIREDEIAARVSGIKTTRYKLGIYAMSAFFSGIAGAIYAHLSGVAGPSNLELSFSFIVILWTVFGGIGTIYGPVAGVYILYPALQFIQVFPIGEELHGIIMPITLILILLFMPEGITVWLRDKIETKCPRCKIINLITRQKCRVCRAPLHLEEKKAVLP